MCCPASEDVSNQAYFEVVQSILFYLHINENNLATFVVDQVMEEKMGAADATSASEAGDIISMEDMKNIRVSNLIAIAPEYEEAIGELLAEGFTRQSTFDSEGVIFLRPPARLSGVLAAQ